MPPRRKKNVYLPIALGSAVVLAIAIGAASYLSNRGNDDSDQGPHASPGGPAPAPTAIPLGPPAACSRRGYQAFIRTHARDLKVPEPTVATLGAPLKGGVEFTGRRVMKPARDKLETAHLRIQTSVEKIGDLGSGQGFRADNLILSITNLTDEPLAYRIETAMDVFDRCSSAAPISHNAVVLNPHETIRRSECTFHPRMKLTVLRVEVYEVTYLGHRFLSRLRPEPASPFDLRVSRAHDFGGQKPCRSLPWRGVEGETIDRWRRVVDFYARHDCDEYSMPTTYEVFKTPGLLPVCDKVDEG